MVSKKWFVLHQGVGGENEGMAFKISFAQDKQNQTCDLESTHFAILFGYLHWLLDSNLD